MTELRTFMNGIFGAASPTPVKQAENAQFAESMNEQPAPGGAHMTGGGAKRTFTVSKADHGIAPGGKYVSPMPLAAAKKAASKLFAKAPASTRKITFTLRETTRGSGKKETTYAANKVKLDKPRVIKRGDVEIKLHHIYQVRSLEC